MWSLLLVIGYVVLSVLDLRKKISLSNVVISNICLLTIPLAIIRYIIFLFEGFFKYGWIVPIILVILTPVALLSILYILIKINVFPCNKKMLQTVSNIKEYKILGAMRLLRGSILANIVYQSAIVFLIITMIKVAPLAIALFHPVLIFFGWFAATYSFFVAPLLIFVLYVIAVIPLINGCIRFLAIEKKFSGKALIILLSLCLGINIILAIVLYIKASKEYKKYKVKKIEQCT